MAEDVGQAYVGIVPSMRGFSARLRTELAAELRGIDGPVNDAGHRAGRGFGDNLREGIRTRLAGIATMLKTGLVIGVAAVTAGLGALTLFGLKSAATLEQTTIGIEALTGSAEEAQKFIGELQQFAAKTPFEFQGVADASRRILAFGAAVGITRDEVIPTLSTIGDLVSVLGGSQQNIDSVVRALGQISSKGKVSQEELLQLAEALPGFNANAAIAASLGLSVGESMEAITRGEVDATTGINALLAGMANFQGAAGAMEKQAGTLLGVFSTFKDTLAISLTNAFQPVIPAIKDALAAVTPVFQSALDELGPSLGGLLESLLPLIGALVQALTPVLTPILDALADTIPLITPALAPLGAALGRVVEAIAPLLPLIGELVAETLVELIPVIDELVPVVAELVPPLADILVALKPLIPPLGELLVAVAKLLVPLAEFTAWTSELSTMSFLVPTVEGLSAAVSGLSGAIEGLAGWLTSIDWGATWDSITNAVSGAWNSITGFFSDLPDRAAAFLSSLPGKLREKATQALDDMAFAVGEGIGKVTRFFIDLPGNVMGFLSELPGRLRDFFTNAGEDAKSALGSKIEQILTFFRELPGRAIDHLRELPGRIAQFGRDLGPQLLQLGRDIVNGIKNGILGAIGGIGDALKSGFNSALAGVKRGLGIASPSKVYMEVGEDTVAGYIAGVEQSARAATAATVAALSPALTSPAAVPAAPPARVTVDAGDSLIAAAIDRIRDTIRQQYGGDVDLALAT